jgi:hypothetical protein
LPRRPTLFPHWIHSDEMIAKLVKAGYLRPEHRHDADAITSAIASMKQALRSGGGDDSGPAAA